MSIRSDAVAPRCPFAPRPSVTSRSILPSAFFLEAYGVAYLLVFQDLPYGSFAFAVYVYDLKDVILGDSYKDQSADAKVAHVLYLAVAHHDSVGVSALFMSAS